MAAREEMMMRGGQEWEVDEVRSAAWKLVVVLLSSCSLTVDCETSGSFSLTFIVIVCLCIDPVYVLLPSCRRLTLWPQASGIPTSCTFMILVI